MTNLATDNVAGGDADSALKNLLTDSSQPTVRRATAPRDPTEDPRFSGKSREQIIEMYANLDSHSGRLANDLGQTRNQLTEALASVKRVADIRDQAPDPAPRQINGVDLIADPNKALNDLLTDREKKLRKETDERIQRLEAEIARTRFERNHPDAQQLFNDPAIATFARGTPLRTNLAQRAVAGDAQAADALLTEYKQYKSSVAEPVANRQSSDAANVSLETGRSSTDATSGGGGKVYKRADIMALRQRDPDQYYSDAVQKALMAAYHEKRVVD